MSAVYSPDCMLAGSTFTAAKTPHCKTTEEQAPAALKVKSGGQSLHLYLMDSCS